jgi:putative phosphoribosyl transferase
MILKGEDMIQREIRREEVSVGSLRLQANLAIPADSTGMVIFAHGSGSSRFSPRNNFVAEILQEGGLSTLLLDLLTPEEEREDEATYEFRFDIDLLASRLIDATDWVLSNFDLGEKGIGYFGSSTGGGAAIVAAAHQTDKIAAIVSRGGRPDLAGISLSKVEAATLLIVGGNDSSVIKLNQAAYRLLNCEKKLEMIPGASHLFEETGKLSKVAALARDWFAEHMHHRLHHH